jgi:small acid-soluble spore protein N (minor)
MMMSNPKRNGKDFVPNHLGTQSRGFGGNKGKQMQNKTGETPQVIQTKGE